jgi:RHS repeat-associated protein
MIQPCRSPGAAGDYFGCAVSISGDWAIVGAEGDSEKDRQAGAAYIFRRDGSSWVEQQKLMPESAMSRAFLGCSVCIRGELAIVGAYQDITPGWPQTGSAYLYRYDQPSSAWVKIKWLPGQLTPDRGDHFGRSVGVDGDHAIVGVELADDLGSNSGAAQMFVSIYGGRMEQQWDLDGVGNWTSTTVNGVTQAREHDEANQITSLDGEDENIAYDAAGNLPSPRLRQAGTTTIPKLPMPGYQPGRFLCTYDAWNRLRFVYEDDGATPGQVDAEDTPVAEYRYDPPWPHGLRRAGGVGRRITKLVRTSPVGEALVWDRTDYFYNEDWQVLEERVTRGLANGEKETIAEEAYAQYVWDIRYIDVPICRFRDADESADGTLEEVLYYLTDANFNVTALVDASGVVAERYMYDGYGRASVLNGDAGVDPDGSWQAANLPEWTLDPDGESDEANEILFGGYRHDPETLLYHVRHRYLHCVLGRWITTDPEGYIDGMSLYAYCRSAPISATDAMGLATLAESIKDGHLSLEEIMQLDLSKEEALMIIGSAMGTPGHDDLRPYTYETLSDPQRRDADKVLRALEDRTERYKCYATLKNVERARFILACRNPATLAFFKETYRLWRGVNPIHYIAERHYAGRTGREPVLGDKTTYADAAGDIILYVVALKGMQWAASYTRGMALAPLGSGAERGVVFSYPKRGSVKVLPGAKPSATQLEQAFVTAATSRVEVTFSRPAGASEAVMSVSPVVGPPPSGVGAYKLGEAASTDYRATFFKAHPELKGKVVVNHLIEQQVLSRYPGRFREAEIHSLENLRGIPKGLNPEVHLRQIRLEWNTFYKQFPNASRQEILQRAVDMDSWFGRSFLPPTGG